MKISLSEISRLLPIVKRRIGAKTIAFVEKIFSSDKLCKDVFGKNYGRKVLLCGIPEAFGKEIIPKYHSNFTETYSAALAFDRLGYSVDCTSRTKRGIDYTGYDIVFGINGNAFMGAFSADKKVKPLRIFYSVGAETCYNYRVTSSRNRDFHSRHGFWLLGSNRYIPGDSRNYYEANFSDAVITLGDSHVNRQFLEEDSVPGKYRMLPAFYFPVCKSVEKKDFGKCKRHFLWFGSSGMIHKGLDIAIDFAVENPDVVLHVCGGSRQEREFWNYYNPIIKNHANIVMHGFVDIESQDFAAILNQCGILLNPSISESGAVSVLNVLGNGVLMPVYSRGTGLDLSAVGLEVEDVTYDSFSKVLHAVLDMDDKDVEEKALAAHKLVKERYTLERYQENMYGILKEIIEKRD